MQHQELQYLSYIMASEISRYNRQCRGDNDMGLILLLMTRYSEGAGTRLCMNATDRPLSLEGGDYTSVQQG